MPHFKRPTGVTLSCCRHLHAGDMSRVLSRTVGFVGRLAPPARLERYDNWWEQRHLYFFCNYLTVSQLSDIVKSPRNLLEVMHCDRCVFVGPISGENSWCLRFYLSWDGEGFNLSGEFDLTLPQGLAAQYRVVMDAAGVELEVQNAEACFDETV